MDSPQGTVGATAGYIPQLLPDETLYSFLGRMCALNCLGSTRERMCMLFGAKNVIPVTDLPTRIEYLQNALGCLSPWSSTYELINQATIYPYHRPFLTLKRHIAVENIMLGASGKSLKTLIGRVANRFGASPELRFCPACNIDDIGTYGAPYWHCTHQLPGVTVCSIHHISLKNYLKNFQKTDRQRIILAPGVFNAEKPKAAPDVQQIAFANLSAELLGARLPVLEGHNYQDIYRDAVLSLGFNRKQYVDYAGLAEVVRSHYCDFNGFQHRERLLSSERSPLNWLRALIERPQRSSHPVCHLLLIGFVFKTIENFSRSLTPAKGEGHRDTVSNGEGTSVLSTTARHERTRQLSTTHKDRMENLALSCRAVAGLTGFSVTTVVNKRRILGLEISERPKTKRSDLVTLIQTMLEEQSSPQQIAQRCDTSLSTVYRVMAQFPDLTRRQSVERFNKERETRRQSWMEMLKTHRGAGLTKIRRAAGDIYGWLYRNDRQWLHDASQCVRISRTALARVNWAARDDELCLQVSRHVEQIARSPKRPRVSRTLMTQCVGDATFRANIERLPKLKVLMDELEESVFAYQCFRINSTVIACVANRQPVINWKIQRLACIRSWMPEHSEYVVEILKKLKTF